MAHSTDWHQPGVEILDFKHAVASISDIPDAILQAELSHRASIRDTAGEKAECGSTERGAYDTSLHVIALFLILALSTLACSFPVLARRFPRLPIPRRFLFLSRHFGTGVLIATAFVHLLPTAFISLTDPCLPQFWSKGYRAMAGFIAMVSVFLVVVVEMFFAMKGAGHVHGNEYEQLIGGAGEEFSQRDQNTDSPSHYLALVTQESVEDTLLLDRIQETDAMRSMDRDPGSVPMESPGCHRQTSSKDTTGHKENDDADFNGLNRLGAFHSNNGQQSCYPPGEHRLTDRSNRQDDTNLYPQNPQRKLLQCLLLEAGILFHSIFIGMALSVATGASFLVLLVAICFHQTFEGFALGSRIASLIPDLFAPTSIKPWLMSLAYGTTTPIGQAIGLMLHNLYDPASTAGLLMVGITNAISSGLLLFAGLVELLAEDFLSDSSYTTLKGRRRVEACVAVASGALLMALVGAFA